MYDRSANVERCVNGKISYRRRPFFQSRLFRCACPSLFSTKTPLETDSRDVFLSCVLDGGVFFVVFSCITFTLQVNSLRGFTLSDLLDKPQAVVIRRCLPFSPPGTCLHFYRAYDSAIPTFYQFFMFVDFSSFFAVHRSGVPGSFYCIPVPGKEFVDVEQQ